VAYLVVQKGCRVLEQNLIGATESLVSFQWPAPSD